jgi:hypothetical protein
MNKKSFGNYITGGLAAIALAVTGPVQAEDWEWTIAPYLWASGVQLDLTVNDNTEIGGDATFKNILDKVDSVFMGHFGRHAQRSRERRLHLRTIGSVYADSGLPLHVDWNQGTDTAG